MFNIKNIIGVVCVGVFLGIFNGLCLAEEGSNAAGPSWKNDTLRVIHNRKSVRHYISRPVSKEDLDILLKAGMAAPTAMDKRPWVFVAIDDQEMLKNLAAKLPYGQMLANAGAAIVVCGDLKKTLPGEAKDFWIQDCSAASENILLAVESLGLGAVWIGVYPSKERVGDVQEVLGIPNNVIPLNGLSIGFPGGDEKPKEKYDPGNIHWNKW